MGPSSTNPITLKKSPMSLESWNVIIGGSSGLGRALAQEYAQSKKNILLISRDAQGLYVLASDLSLRFGVQASYLECDITSPHFQPQDLMQKILSICPGIESFNLVAGGSFPEDDHIPSYDALKKSLDLNFYGPAQTLIALLKSYDQHQVKTILVVTSIACIRPRSSNVSYTSSKVALESFTLSLQHSAFQSGLNISFQIMRMGYMESIFTKNKKLLFPVASPQNVAHFLVQNRDKNLGVFYFPKFWSLIAMILNYVPYFLFKRLRF